MRVSVAIEDDLVPFFAAQQYSVSMSEGALTGASVFRASATDPEDDVLTYRITSGNDDEVFTIEEST